VPFPIADKLVVAIASSALFDLAETDRIYREKGLEEYRRFQRAHEKTPLKPGVAFPFIKRLLSLNGQAEADRPVEVILLSRNDPDTGLRAFRSMAAHGLDITRGAFLSGRPPWRYLDAFNASLFLSADQTDIREAVRRGYPAGLVLHSDSFVDEESDDELRVAFDFDGVVVDDAAEQVFHAEGLSGFQDSEAEQAATAHRPGPLTRLFREIAALQQWETERRLREPGYRPRIRTAIITSRGAPAHERVVTTLRSWGIRVDETIFLGGMEKRPVLEVFRPHIFFDDQMTHAGPASGTVPAVHVPFGALNELEG
jgi:5'-nucleotidase